MKKCIDYTELPSLKPNCKRGDNTPWVSYIYTIVFIPLHNCLEIILTFASRKRFSENLLLIYFSYKVRSLVWYSAILYLDDEVSYNTKIKTRVPMGCCSIHPYIHWMKMTEKARMCKHVTMLKESSECVWMCCTSNIAVTLCVKMSVHVARYHMIKITRLPNHWFIEWWRWRRQLWRRHLLQLWLWHNRGGGYNPGYRFRDGTPTPGSKHWCSCYYNFRRQQS